MPIRVVQNKGKKDPYTLLSKRMLEVLQKYFTTYELKEWLFEGDLDGQDASRCFQNQVKDAAKKAGIKKRVTEHTFRHIFATHLLKAGTDLR